MLLGLAQHLEVVERGQATLSPPVGDLVERQANVGKHHTIELAERGHHDRGDPQGKGQPCGQLRG
jgi:hypothetical protein